MTRGADISAEGTQVIAALGSVIDPELGIDIMNLGLVYRIEIDDGDVSVLMTLTVPGCPMSASIRDDVRRTVGALPWVRHVDLEITFDPPWSPERLSANARERLGR